MIRDAVYMAQASIASLLAFSVGGIIPLLGGIFITDPRIRLAVVLVRPIRLAPHPAAQAFTTHLCFI